MEDASPPRNITDGELAEPGANRTANLTESESDAHAHEDEDEDPKGNPAAAAADADAADAADAVPPPPLRTYESGATTVDMGSERAEREGGGRYQP